MARRSFTVRAIWDPEAGVFYSESDIVGFHIEAETLDAFEALIVELAPGLVLENHISKADLASATIVDVYDLEALLAGITPDNLHAETPTGQATCNEI